MRVSRASCCFSVANGPLFLSTFRPLLRALGASIVDLHENEPEPGFCPGSFYLPATRPSGPHFRVFPSRMGISSTLQSKRLYGAHAWPQGTENVPDGSASVKPIKKSLIERPLDQAPVKKQAQINRLYFSFLFSIAPFRSICNTTPLRGARADTGRRKRPRRGASAWQKGVYQIYGGKRRRKPPRLIIQLFSPGRRFDGSRL